MHKALNWGFERPESLSSIRSMTDTNQWSTRWCLGVAALHELLLCWCFTADWMKFHTCQNSLITMATQLENTYTHKHTHCTANGDRQTDEQHWVKIWPSVPAALSLSHTHTHVMRSTHYMCLMWRYVIHTQLYQQCLSIQVKNHSDFFSMYLLFKDMHLSLICSAFWKQKCAAHVLINPMIYDLICKACEWLECRGAEHLLTCSWRDVHLQSFCCLRHTDTMHWN